MAEVPRSEEASVVVSVDLVVEVLVAAEPEEAGSKKTLKYLEIRNVGGNFVMTIFHVDL